MQIGQVIRKYRKEKAMTQEEMAGRLGVTAPAVNKWENGNSYPDISLLSPIARLLGISLETLLSFHEDLTADEIKCMVLELDSKFKKESFDEVFEWAKERLEIYPNCEQLIWQFAVILDAQGIVKKVPDTEKYDKYIYDCYVRVLKSADEDIRTKAADSLFGYHMRKEEYEKAEEYILYFSKQNPERKRKLAQVYSNTDRVAEAYRTYEELLFEEYGMINLALQGIYTLSLKDGDVERAHLIADKMEGLARLLERGRYNEISCRLDLAAYEKDREKVLEIRESLLESLETIGDFRYSKLYEHMTFQEIRPEFLEELRENLIKCFEDE